jgi:hypothetical protein
MFTYLKMHLDKVSTKMNDLHEQTLMGTIASKRTFAIAYLLMSETLLYVTNIIFNFQPLFHCMCGLLAGWATLI